MSILLYFGLTSLLAGAALGLGFIYPFSRSVSKADERRLAEMGVVRPLDVEPLSGLLVVHPEGRRPTIIFIHGRSANRMQMFPLARRLFREGYNAVLWDLRGHGNSGGRPAYGKYEAQDVVRVVDQVRGDPSVDPDRIALVGFSLGAAMAIGAAAADGECRISGVVADSPYADFQRTAFRYMRLFGWIPSFMVWPAAKVAFLTGGWASGADLDRLNPRDWAASVRAPTLLIHGTKDWRITPDNSREILARIPVRKELWMVEGAGHTGAFAKDEEGYTRRVVDFLSSVSRAECVAAMSD